MALQTKIKEIEEEMGKTQINKKTEYHLGQLKAKLAKYKTQIFDAENKSGPKGDGFDVVRYGDARIAMIGFPSVGKSSLLTKLTKTFSVAAAYHFTTLECIPGIICYKDAKIQLLDLPGIIEGASQGIGRGKQVIATARSADLILMLLDISKAEEEKAKLTKELESVGIRLNQSKPDIVLKKMPGMCGVMLHSTINLTHIDEKMVKDVLKEYKIFNADITIREDITVDQLIDAIEENRKYVNCVYAYNKIDLATVEEINAIARKPMCVPISCNLELGFDMLLRYLWKGLALVRIYTKKRGNPPDFVKPLILSASRNGYTIESALNQIHKALVKDFKHAYVWGRSVKYSPQRCGLSHVLSDEDVIQAFRKSCN